MAVVVYGMLQQLFQCHGRPGAMGSSGLGCQLSSVVPFLHYIHRLLLAMAFLYLPAFSPLHYQALFGHFFPGCYSFLFLPLSSHLFLLIKSVTDKLFPFQANLVHVQLL